MPYRGPACIPTAYDNLSESIYYPSHETESTISAMTKQSLLQSRNYIDPWDMENYVYIQRTIDESIEPVSSTPSPAGEPISSMFYYISGNRESDECTGCLAGLDEQCFFNDKYETISDDDPSYRTYTVNKKNTHITFQNIESSAIEESNNSSEESTISTLKLHTSGFRMASGQRNIVLPKPKPKINFPSPPPPSPPPQSYGYYNFLEIESTSSLSERDYYCTISECYECMNSIESMPIYDTTTTERLSTTPTITKCFTYSPPYFALSKKGLLQIDYSCNWNNLHYYIRN